MPSRAYTSVLDLRRDTIMNNVRYQGRKLHGASSENEYCTEDPGFGLLTGRKNNWSLFILNIIIHHTISLGA